MSNADGRGRDVKCPFYKGCSPRNMVVSCEGYCGAKYGAVFENLQDYRVYVSGFCRARYTECPIYAGLMEKKYEG